MDPNAHEYYHATPACVLRRAKQNKDPTAPSNHEDDVTCVICMNFTHLEVDEHGGLIQINALSSPEAPTEQAESNSWVGSYTARISSFINRTILRRQP